MLLAVITLVAAGVLPTSIGDSHCRETIGPCPSSSWVQHGLTCYTIAPDEKLDWYAAKKTCTAMGGSLAVPRSPDENVFLSQLIRGGPDAWVDCYNNGTGWGCGTDGALDDSYWMLGEPQAGTEVYPKYCATIVADDNYDIKVSSGWLRSLFCFNQRPAICSSPLSPTLHT